MNYEEISKEEAISNWYEKPIYVKDKNSEDIYRIEIKRDRCPESPRKWDNVCTIISGSKGDWAIGDKKCQYDRETWKEKVMMLEKDPNVYIRPVYMYDHSQQTISLSPFGDPWDSGICGHIYVTKERLFKECMNVTDENWKEKAQHIMESEIKIYDDFIVGYVYGFKVEKQYIEKHKRVDTGKTWITLEWEEVDSCCGFYGNDMEENGLLETALGNIGKDYIFIKIEE